MSTEVPPRSDSYPVRVDAELDPQTSRALWLVKWLLAIPHYVVLSFLGVAFTVTSVLAFFAILFAGRYPRAMFDFNVGVLRWSWRVTFYAYGALGTDRYPPFSLHDVADYPAHLDVDYPEHLSRGLVLVKWWLLAIPQYLVLFAIFGGGGYAATDGDLSSAWVPGLLGVLVLVAAGYLLFAGRYPEPLFDLVVGLNRWGFRIVGYVTLMTDRYPPFALDQGGRDPGGARRPQEETGWSAGRAVSLTFGSVLVATGLTCALIGAVLGVVDVGAKDRDGYFMSDQTDLSTRTSAITSASVDLRDDAPGDFLPDVVTGDVRVTAEPVAGAELFLGLARTRDVEDYLAGVDYVTVTDLRDGRPVYRAHAGSDTAAAPGEQDFWTAQDSGRGRLSIDWKPADGEWSYVLMNADGSPAVRGDVEVGAELPIIGTLAAVVAVTGLVLILLGFVLVALALRAASRHRRGSLRAPPAGTS
ncbi:DUF4389 domain-containing protein [Nocardioides sp. cx-169]|uniref:DUF4389 domain-containing protein n=1 Tax=Nocardioides sp. cx-169 TaxID=2899080 RepID=UPI001E5865C5|nr:DUF4389 domain-containing protein [Nocardioides sp. cx-169]MCD4533696.1 DUF4389 domain-containing protein [Nocardioides sp. cx-169]